MKTNMELNIIASQVEANTTASFPILLEDETFKNMFEKEIKTSKNLFDIAQTLSKFANEELIQKGYMKMKMNYKVIANHLGVSLRGNETFDELLKIEKEIIAHDQWAKERRERIEEREANIRRVDNQIRKVKKWQTQSQFILSEIGF